MVYIPSIIRQVPLPLWWENPELMAHLVPRHLCVVAAATFLWMSSFYLWPSIWLTISGSDRTMVLTYCAQTREASRQPKQPSKSFKGSFKEPFPDSSDMFKTSGTVPFVPFPIWTNALLPMRKCLGSGSTITLGILPLRAISQIGGIQTAAQLQISCCEDGMHWMDGCS